jgi:hypothetical protein
MPPAQVGIGGVTYCCPPEMVRSSAVQRGFADAGKHACHGATSHACFVSMVSYWVGAGCMALCRGSFAALPSMTPHM